MTKRKTANEQPVEPVFWCPECRHTQEKPLTRKAHDELGMPVLRGKCEECDAALEQHDPEGEPDLEKLAEKAIEQVKVKQL